MTTNKPIAIVPKEKAVVVVKKEDVERLVTQSERPEVAKLICAKDWNCEIALAVAKAESGMREEAMNINTNNTVDVGVFQINSVHYGKEGCSLREVSTIEGNVECAYKLYKASGWHIWAAYVNRSYLANL